MNKKGFGTNLIPLVLIELFISMTYFLYRCGPWMYPYRKDNLTLLFMLGCLILFAIGYCVVICRKSKNKIQYNEKKNINKLINIVIAVNLLLLIPYCIVRVGTVFPNIVESLENLSIAYNNATLASGNYRILHILVGFGTLFMYAIYHIAYFYWETLSIPKRAIAVFECLWYILVDMCTGRNKPITVVIIIISIMTLIKLVDNTVRRQKWFYIRTIITFVLLFSMVFGYFYATLNERGNNTISEVEGTELSTKEIVLSGDDTEELIVDQYGYKDPIIDEDNSLGEYEENEIDIVPGHISEKIVERFETYGAIAMKVHPYYADEFSYSYVNLNDKLYCALPEKLAYLYVVGSNYVSHGYHGVTLALREPFESCFGIGHITILQNVVKNITGIDVYQRTYVYKLNQDGYPVSLKWGTAFIQWASDISFYGVVVLMGILGMLVAQLWKEVLENKNLLSLMLLTSLSVNILFITSWWQAGVSGSDFIWFYGTLAIWIINKIKNFMNIRRIKKR